MTIKEFSKKYDVPIVRLRAAMDLGKLRRNGGVGSHYENKMQYSEDDMVTAWYAYLREDMSACIDRAWKDDRLIKEFCKKAAKKE